VNAPSKVPAGVLAMVGETARRQREAENRCLDLLAAEGFQQVHLPVLEFAGDEPGSGYRFRLFLCFFLLGLHFTSRGDSGGLSLDFRLNFSGANNTSKGKGNKSSNDGGQNFFHLYFLLRWFCLFYSTSHANTTESCIYHKLRNLLY